MAATEGIDLPGEIRVFVSVSRFVRSLWGVLALALVVSDGAAAEEGPFDNSSLRGTYTYAAIFSSAGEPFPNSAILGLLYFDGEGDWIFANLITNLPGAPDPDGSPTRFLMNSLADLELPWPHVRGTYAVNPDGSFLFDIGGGQGAFEGVVKHAEMIGGVLVIEEYIMVDTAPSRFGGGLAVFNVWRIVEENILPPE